MAASLAFYSEIEDAIANGSKDRRGAILRRVTDLFIVGSDAFSDDEVGVFDDVILRLAADIEVSARAMLAERLAPIQNAPPRTVRALAFDNAIEVAAPILIHSERLDDPTLTENASEKSQEHLLAITRRRSLSEMVTDVLVKRGDQQVLLSAAGNDGARFSDSGFATLVERSNGDDLLAQRVGGRPEIPPPLFQKLLATASAIVRAKLEAAHPQAKDEVQRAVAAATSRVGARARVRPLDYSGAQKIVGSLHDSGLLDDGKIGAFAKDGRFEEVTAALALLCRLSIEFVEAAMLEERSDTVVILAKAGDLSWSSIKAILLLRAGRHFTAGSDIAPSLANFERLRPATAKEITRLYRLRAPQDSAPAN
jgi:uncharacterized protein (DUF2336 family)